MNSQRSARKGNCALRKRLAEAERRCAELPALREEAADLVARMSALTLQLAEAEAAPAALDVKDAEITELHRCAGSLYLRYPSLLILQRVLSALLHYVWPAGLGCWVTIQ